MTKVFHGSGYSQLVERFKKSFRVVKAVKPKASRDKSAETFLVGSGLKAALTARDATALLACARMRSSALVHWRLSPQGSHPCLH